MYLNVVEKIWGVESWVVNNELYCMKELVVKPRGCSSLHYHNLKDETWIVDYGLLGVDFEKKRLNLGPGDTLRIKPKQLHMFFNLDRIRKVFIREVSTHHDDKDVVRLEASKII